MIGLVAAALLTSAVGAQAVDPGARGDTGPGATVLGGPVAGESPWTRDPTGVRQELGVGLHATTFWSKESSHYTFYSLGIAYLVSNGSWGPFAHVTGFLPLQARQDGRVYAAGRVYGNRIGGDFLFGWQKRWYPSRNSELELGPGFHGSVLWMPGAQGYRDFSAMPLGVGVEAAMRWSTGQRIAGRVLRAGWFATTALDLYDPLRSNDLRNGFTVLVGVITGLDRG